MSLTLEHLWTAAGVLLGFQVTSSTWRIAREVRAIALEFLCDSNTRCGIMEVYSSLFFRENHEPT
jgi:hypothetical protein